MLALTNVLDLFSNKLSGLRARSFPFALVFLREPTVPAQLQQSRSTNSNHRYGSVAELLLVISRVPCPSFHAVTFQPALCEHPNGFIMSAFGCQHQSRLAFIILRLHVCLGDEQRCHYLIVSEPRCFD